MIYLVRHGQTEFNAVRRFQGALDSSLTALGQAQARAMGLALRDLVDPAQTVILSSPRGRTLETARLLAEAVGIVEAPIVDDGLAEVSLGSWDGRTREEVDAEWPGLFASLDPLGWFFETPDGERYEPFEARLAAALTRAADHPAPVKIIVSHGVAGRVLRGLHAGMTREQAQALSVPQGVIYRFDPGAIQEIDCSAALA